MKTIKYFGMLMLLAIISLNAQTFKASGDSRNQASFESDAPLENIVGVSNSLEAVAMIDINDITNMPKGKVNVDLNSLKTGIDLRDEHLRSANWLNTEKFPYATFMLTGISDASQNKLEDGKRVKATLHGKFSVHGVTKDVDVPAELTYFKENARTRAKMKGNLLKVKASFDINLGDYGIKIPDMVVGKVDDNVKINVTFIATDANAAMGNPCGGCNPCGMHKDGKCNPCGMQKEGKCNPCGMHKSKDNPCGMSKAKCNPCGGLK
ncbi:MAG: YceI family protein [Ignavibacteria bacterium]|nr:MAG: YceI family protein [Ignavibacteria bacterium]